MSPDSFRHGISSTSTQLQLTSAAECPADTAVSSVPSLSILVAECSEAKQKDIRNILERAGHRVAIVPDGDAALDALALCIYDLIVMNIHLPEMNGIDASKVYRFISLDKPRVPIVAVTDDANENIVRRCKEAGIDACISEPIDPDDLLELIEKIVQESGTPQIATTSISRPTAYELAHLGDYVSCAEPFDLITLDALEHLGGAEFVDALAAQIRNDASVILRELAEFKGAGNLQVFRDRLQALRCAVSNIGASGLSEMCLVLQKTSPENLSSQGETYLKELQEEFGRVCVALQGRFSEWGAMAQHIEKT